VRAEVLACLSVWSDVQIICIWSPAADATATPSLLASLKSRLVQLTFLVPVNSGFLEKKLMNKCCCCLLLLPFVVVTSPAGAVANYCDEHVCLCVCLSVCQDISRTTRAIFTNFSVHVAYSCGSVLLRQGDQTPKETASFGGFPHQ